MSTRATPQQKVVRVLVAAYRSGEGHGDLKGVTEHNIARRTHLKWDEVNLALRLLEQDGRATCINNIVGSPAHGSISAYWRLTDTYASELSLVGPTDSAS